MGNIYAPPKARGFLTFSLLPLGLLIIYVMMARLILMEASVSVYGIKLAIDAALLSLFCAMISVILGYILAYIIFVSNFWGRSIIIQILRLLIILPIMLWVVGIINIYGRNGLIGQWLGIQLIYNNLGVIIGFCLLNIPYACLIFLAMLQNIPQNQWLIATQLNITGFTRLRYVVAPYMMKSVINALLVIFFMCFTSFEIVLMLGGGKVKNLTTALYNAITLGDWVMIYNLGAIQMVIALCAFGLFIRSSNVQNQKTGFLLAPRFITRLPYNIRMFCMICMLAMLISPMISIIVKGVSPAILQVFKQAEFYPALWDSFSLSFAVAACVMLVTIGLAIYERYYTLFIHVGLVLPSYLLLSTIMIMAYAMKISIFAYGQILAIMLISLSIIPLIAQMVLTPLRSNIQHMRYLSLQLNMRLDCWLYHIIWCRNWRLITAGFLLSFAMAFGSYSVLAFLHDDDFTPLMVLLVDYMGRYRFALADHLAIIILLLYIILFLIFKFLDHTEKAHEYAHH